MPSISASIPKELDDRIEKAIPKYGNKSSTIATLIDEAFHWRDFPMEKRVISFYNYMRSDERLQDLKSSALWDENKSEEILAQVYPFDIANWKGIIAGDGHAFL